MSNQRILIVSYAAGLMVMIGSYALFVHLRGFYGNNLAWLVVFLSQFVGTLVSLALAALLFPATCMLIKARRRYVRVIGFLLATVLAYLALVWFRTPLPPYDNAVQ